MFRTSNATGAAERLVRYGLAVTLAAVVLWLVHAPILTLLASGLIVEDTTSVADCVVLMGGDRQLEYAARRYRDGQAASILLLEPRPDRVVRLGIVDSPTVVVSERLVSLGVPRNRIEIAVVLNHEVRQSLRAVQDWMRQHTGKTVCILCDRFASRRIRYLAGTSLEAAEVERTAIVGLVDRRFSESDWWTNRKGCKALLAGYLGLLYSWVADENAADLPDWEPDVYEASLRSAIRS